MPLLEIKHITGGYTRNPVLKDVSFEVGANEIVGLIGLNGAGKSTTIKHIIGLMEPHKVKRSMRAGKHTGSNLPLCRKLQFFMTN
jgi:ABC-2 type transport system ATP-binding protein